MYILPVMKDHLSWETTTFSGRFIQVSPYCMTRSWQSDHCYPWWRHQMETFSALLAICAGNSPVSGEFLAQRPVTRSFDVFFDARLNKRLSKHSRGWWFETLSHPLWRHRNASTSPVYLILILLPHTTTTTIIIATITSTNSPGIWVISQTVLVSVSGEANDTALYSPNVSPS